MKTIAVLFGGKSSEYEVSLQSATAVLDALDQERYEVIKIGITKSGEWYQYIGDNESISADCWLEENCRQLTPAIGESWKGFTLLENQEPLPVDVLFPVMHGEFVEDGRIQGVFEWMEVPYVGCGVASSAVCMNKKLTHRFANSIGIKTAPSIQCSLAELDMNAIKKFIRKEGFPLFIKPLRGGSSKGISKLNELEELSKVIASVKEIDTHFILEKGVNGFEVGCGILGNEQLVIGEVDEIELASGFFDYTEKYQLISSTIHMPARINETLKGEIKFQAERLYRLLGCRGLARIDFFLTHNGEILLNEINTLPGFTEHSRYPSMLMNMGLSYREIVERLIQLAEEGGK
ncbi:D-alanine--D-alanine ligase [Enterococcus sp. BWT-B8]|uniref:D-alanine--D-alanine ligase family protein n=1 Tax=Enterococcus sp. BWT-B8 TaxID=2885157 RepID=UPI001E30DC8C|nr:D-alanine--D-alanine ligase family protein [Enterococcus sp. BWT-B8]MCB5953356.1 D-alanine--D-alanine ligase [Enterococcus sp. BWT-B8]